MSFTVKDLLKIQVAPALGCTEPVAIALGAAAAASLLETEVYDKIEIWLDPNIYKNGLAAVIPVGQGLIGLEMASAVGAVGGDPSLGLEVLESVEDKDIKTAKALAASGRIKVNLLEDTGLHIRTRIRSGENTAESVIEELHNRITSLVLNGEPVSPNPLLTTENGNSGGSGLEELEHWLKGLGLDEIVALVDDFDQEDMSFIEDGVTCNMRLSEYGLKHGSGLGIGNALERLVRQKILTRDMILNARILTSAASDARMGGVKMPAMSSAGSGNHGLTAILPVWALRDFVEHDRETMLRSIGLSHIITAYVKAHTGRLSAVCGCSVAAGAGAAAGATYLMGGHVNHISGAIKNIMEDLAGVICDGAKPGCAVKLATAAGAAVQAALFSLQGVNVKATDGIIGHSSEETVKNIGTLSTNGMIETDRTILKIMVEKQFS